MKKFSIFIMVLNFVACTTNQTENDSNQLTIAHGVSFNPEPTPEEYQKANYPSFMKDLDFLAKKTFLTKKQLRLG